jgi:hypothetical protein
MLLPTTCQLLAFAACSFLKRFNRRWFFLCFLMTNRFFLFINLPVIMQYFPQRIYACTNENILLIDLT